MEINCNIAGDLLAPYLDGTCSQDTRKLLEAHLAECAACREKLRRMRGEDEEMPEEALVSAEEIRRNLTAYAKRVARRRAVIAIASAALGILAVCILTLAGLAVQDMRRTALPPVYSVPPEVTEDPDADIGGSAWDPSRWEGVYDLTTGPLETTAGEVGEFVLFTNNAAVAVEITGADREVYLWNVENPEHPIRFSQAAPHVFEGLSAAWRYRVTVDAPESTPVTVTDGRVVSFWASLRRVIGEIF